MPWRKDAGAGTAPLPGLKNRPGIVLNATYELTVKVGAGFPRPPGFD